MATTKTAKTKNATSKNAKNTSKGKGPKKPKSQKKTASASASKMKDHLLEETARLESQRTTTTQQVDQFDTGSVASGKGSWIKPVAITLAVVFGLILLLLAVKIMFPGLGQVTTITAPAPVVAPAVVASAPIVAPAPAIVTTAPAIVAPAPVIAVAPAPVMQLPASANVASTPNGTNTTPGFDGWEKVTINKVEMDIPEGLKGLMKIYKGFSDVQTLDGQEVRYMLTQAPGSTHPTYTRGPLPPAEHFLPTPDGFTKFIHDGENIAIAR